MHELETYLFEIRKSTTHLLRMYRWPSTRLLLIFTNGNLQRSNSQFQERIFQITSINRGTGLKVIFPLFSRKNVFSSKKDYQYSGLYFLRYIFCVWSPADIVYTNTLYTVYSCMFDAKEIRERVGSTFTANFKLHSTCFRISTANTGKVFEFPLMGFWMVFKDFPCILSM
jgi:hypothetical protein